MGPLFTFVGDEAASMTCAALSGRLW
eukprot:COSAG01_NODE_81201_length_113_cov_134.142857_1_plen_25_part_01